MHRHISIAPLILTVIAFISLSEVAAQQSTIQELQRRVLELEQVVSQLQQRVVELEANVQGQQDSTPMTVSGGNWREITNWRGLRKGMTMQQVVGLLGEPERVQTMTTMTFWYWGYPGGGRVSFDSGNRLQGWTEPSL